MESSTGSPRSARQARSLGLRLDPVLFLRERPAGLTSALGQTPEAMNTREDLPSHLLSIAGIHRKSNTSKTADSRVHHG